MAAPLVLRFPIVAAIQSADTLVASPIPRIKYQSHLQLHSLTHVGTASVAEKSQPLHPPFRGRVWYGYTFDMVDEGWN